MVRGIVLHSNICIVTLLLTYTAFMQRMLSSQQSAVGPLLPRSITKRPSLLLHLTGNVRCCLGRKFSVDP